MKQSKTVTLYRVVEGSVVRMRGGWKRSISLVSVQARATPAMYLFAGSSAATGHRKTATFEMAERLGLYEDRDLAISAYLKRCLRNVESAEVDLREARASLRMARSIARQYKVKS